MSDLRKMTINNSEHKERLKVFAISAQDAKYAENGTRLDVESQSIETIVSLYLDWVNNFLTLPHFARYYCITTNQAQQIIDDAKELLAIREVQ